jgi:L-asparaginase
MAQHGTDDTGRGSARVAVLGLGGTIAMRPVDQGAVPGLTTEDLVARLPADVVQRVAQVENFRQLPGAHLSLRDLVELAARIDALGASGAADGFVVVQGTDTIEETVFALELLCRGASPVVVTGAMRHAGQISPDGAANIANAICLAAAPQARGRGAMVCFNDEVHCAWAVQKTAAINPAAFSSPGFGPLGHVVEGRAELRLESRRWPAVASAADRVEPAPVALLAAALGEGPELVDAVGRGAWRGLVVQALGAGHLPAEWVGPLENLARAMPVVLATRVSRGPVLSETYAFPGSERDLLARGLLSAGYLCASKARILLSLGLGAGRSNDSLRVLFDGGFEADRG